MSDSVELAQDSLERAHGEPAAPEGLIRWAAILASSFAAMAVVVEMSANHAQTRYLATHVSASDIWTQYQGKSERRAVYEQSAAMLDALSATVGSAPAGEAARAGAAEARQEAARMQSEPGADGMDQLSARAQALEAERDHALGEYEQLERAARGLQIAVVLSGLFMVTRMRWLLAGGICVGGAGLVLAGLLALGVV